VPYVAKKKPFPEVEEGKEGALQKENGVQGQRGQEGGDWTWGGDNGVTSVRERRALSRNSRRGVLGGNSGLGPARWTNRSWGKGG